MFPNHKNMGKEPQFMVLLYMVLELWECTWHNNDRRTVYISPEWLYGGVLHISIKPTQNELYGIKYSMFLLFGNWIKIIKIIRFILSGSNLWISNARLCDARQSNT